MRFSGLSVRQLEAFDMIMRTGSVSAAARAMRVSQPSVSRLLKELEADTGLPLFDRSNGRLEPTTQGVLFHGEVSKTFNSVQQLYNVAQEIKDLKRSTVRVAALLAASLDILPAALRSFRSSHPETALMASVRASKEIVSAVASQLTDVGIVDADVAFLDAICLRSFRLNSLCVMDSHHPLADRTVIELADFQGFPFVSLGGDYLRRTRDGARLCDAVADRVDAQAFQSLVACGMVSDSRALAVVDPFTAAFYGRNGLRAVPLALDIPFNVALIVNQRSRTDVAVLEFIELVSSRIELNITRPTIV